MRPTSRSAARVVPVVLFAATTFLGCPCDSVVNENPWLRWKVFSIFGAGRVCDEMMKRGAPLRLASGGASVGRFVPSRCDYATNDDARTLTIHMSGDGYAWTAPTRRVGFWSEALVHYQPDFYKASDAIYVWFRPVQVQSASFQLQMSENPAAQLGQMTPLGYFTNWFGAGFMAGELGRGFTVIHESGGDDFELGILQPPARPAHVFKVHGSDRYTLANDTSEIHAEQMDFIGPFEVDASDRALFLRMRVTGPAVDAVLVARDVGEAWRRQYQSSPGAPRPPGPTLAGGPVYPGADFTQTFPLPRGQYYLVVDNSSAFGVAPPAAIVPLPGLTDSAATVSYVLQLGDVP